MGLVPIASTSSDKGLGGLDGLYLGSPGAVTRDSKEHLYLFVGVKYSSGYGVWGKVPSQNHHNLHNVRS